MVIDAHQHFWYYDPDRDTWIDDSMQAIRRDYLPGELKEIYRKNGFDGSVAVQAPPTSEETRFLLDLSSRESFIKAVVGWIDFDDPAFQEILEEYSQEEKLAGFRHILQIEEPEYMLRDEFLQGIGALKRFDFTYDILIYPRHLNAAIELSRLFPEQTFVVDHLAKPPITSGELSPWRERIRLLAEAENVFCKVSGMVTEADWNHWKPEDFTPYLDTVFEAFGTRRLMFGSDWPVCLLAGSFEQVTGLVKTYLKNFTETEKRAVFGENAAQFYRIE